jgi:hypothetical protein
VAGRHRKTRSRQHHRGRHRKPPSLQLTVLPTVTAVALLAVGGVGLGHALAHGQPHSASVGVAGAHVVPPPVTASATTSPAPSPSTTPSSRPSRRPVHHVLHHRIAPAALTVTDIGPACYVQVTTKRGHLLVRRILHGHQHLAFRRHGLDVVLGNAGGVRIAIDGHHAHRAGRSGEVLRFGVR